ncbi:PepSY-associated TM helix domain-containing protein, partial [Pseudomonas peli]|uniref:PepSY-associated TM helix domain-containing protein n=1 Tax=Pseudomonas peli TaxID=592361 RepID=UPI003D31483E
MLLFAVTGITLNHAAQIEAKPQVISHQAQFPDALHAALQAKQPSHGQPLIHLCRSRRRATSV